MKYRTGIICVSVALGLGGLAQAESFLTAESFPKTINDVSFVDRMKNLADGYDDFDPEYDENGRCISGCAYIGMKLEDELAAITRNTEAARQQLERYKLEHPQEFSRPPETQNNDSSNNNDTNPESHNPPVKPEPSVESITPPAPPQKPQEPETPQKPQNPQPQQSQKPQEPQKPQQQPVARKCTQYSSTIRPNMNAVIQAPLDGTLVISSDFGKRVKPCARCSTQHRGVDLRAGVGTNVYTPANGTVVSVTSASSNCGNGVVIDHPDGYRTTYCHFSKVLVKVGDQVQGGCLIGKSGNTGASTGPHLHYAIKYNGTWIDPLYNDNRLGREYSFQSGTKPSEEHAGKKLPGKTN